MTLNDTLDFLILALKDSDGIMHFVFTLHVYQYRVDKSGKGAGGKFDALTRS